MKNLIVILGVFFSSYLFAQSNRTEALDTAVLKKINMQVSVEALQFKKQLIKNKMDHERITFCVDTFIINHIQADRIKANNSTLAVNKSMSAVCEYSCAIFHYGKYKHLSNFLNSILINLNGFIYL